MAANIEQVKLAMADSDFVAKISAMEDPVEVQKAFAEKGVDFTLDEINNIAEQACAAGAAELSEAEMETVTGGVDPFSCAAIVLGGIKLGADLMTTINNNRKAKGKKTIW